MSSLERETPRAPAAERRREAVPGADPDEERFRVDLERRSSELLPAILLTLLSIIQALALEVLWTRIHESPHLWGGGRLAWIGWLQVSAAVLGIVVMWIFYVSLVVRFTWQPGVRDSVAPFVLGGLEFIVSYMLDPARLHLWLYVLAALFVVAPATSAQVLVAARRHPANRAYFERFPFQPGRSLAASGAFCGVLLAGGAWVQIAGVEGIAPFAALLAANGALLAQGGIIRHYWHLPVSTRGRECSGS